jgi:8-oxo-dGTP pyrophosphatase MutT (NUDIX family)
MREQRIRTVSAFLRNSEGKVIAQLRDDKPGLLFPSCWSTLGGRVEDDETPEEAVRRELLEEIEQCPPLTFWRMFEHRFSAEDIAYDVAIYAYVGEIESAISEIRLHEGQRLAYLSAEEVDRLPFAFGLDRLYREFFTTYDGRAGSHF